MTQVALGHERDDGGARLEQREHLRVLRRQRAGAPRGAERGERGVAQRQLAACPGEELGVLGVGARPPALDVADPELVEVGGDGELVGDGEVQALLLRTIAQGGVVDVQVVHRRSRLDRSNRCLSLLPGPRAHPEVGPAGPGCCRCCRGAGEEVVVCSSSSHRALPSGAGCAPATKKPPGFGRSARRVVPVALVDDEGGGRHDSPGGLHRRKTATARPHCEPASRDVVGTGPAHRQAATRASNSRASWPVSGCHCTARRNAAPGSSIASSVPSSAHAAGT